MESLTISLELTAIQEKTRRLAVWSFLAHAAAIVLFLAVASEPRPVADDNYVITEITWLETEITPVEIAQATPEPVQTEPVATLVPEQPKQVIPPRDAGIDLLQQRLADLRADDAGRLALTSATVSTKPDRPIPATLGTFAAVPKPSGDRLNRATVRPVSRLTELPKEKPSVVAVAVTALPNADRDEPAHSAEEIMPGISLAGQVSNRQLLAYTTPEYPEWAKIDGVEVSVELYFTVLPGGNVKENVLIERTSGFDDFDRRAEAALATWRFEKLEPGISAEQWGRIEFKYILRDAG